MNPADFDACWISPLQPTTLAQQKWLPLLPTDFNFYSAVNSFTVPKPLDAATLKSSLAQTLQLFSPHAGRIARNPETNTYQVRLTNQPVRLRIGCTTEPGPFAKGWSGERHAVYFDELPRGDLSAQSGKSDVPLFQAMVTTWSETGQTAIMVSQNYCLGDAFAAVKFMQVWSDFYQGKKPPAVPTFEKYALPPPIIELRASHIEDLKNISWMVADYDADFHRRRVQDQDARTRRMDLTFSADFVDRICRNVRKRSGNARLSRHDAFAGYIVSLIKECLTQDIHHIHQLVALRNKSLTMQGKTYHIPITSTGNAYMIWETPMPDHGEAASIGTRLYAARRDLDDADKLGRIYTLYNSFYEKAVYRNHMFVDSGYKDVISMNWIVGAGLNDAHFGFPLQSGHIEWEAVENFVEIWRANPTIQADGQLRAEERGLQMLVRLERDAADRLEARLRDDEQERPSTKL